jgi:methionyl-tRNA formyltransferase
VEFAYLGTSGFAAGLLRRICDAGSAPGLVVTRPDRPAGRGRRLTAPPVADAAVEMGIDVFQPEDVNDAASVERIAAGSPDLLVVCAYGALVGEALLERYEILNVHPSLLPRWRGAAPIERAIMAGDGETGVSIMQLTAGLDSGPVCLSAREPIHPRDTWGSLSERLEELGARLLLEAMESRPPFVEQDEELVTWAEKIAAGDRTINPSAPAAEQERLVRALSPHVGARLALPDGSFLGVLEAHLEEGRLVPDRVLPPGGRAMGWDEYLRGHEDPLAGS